MNDGFTKAWEVIKIQNDKINLILSKAKPGIERFISNLDTFSEKLIQSGWTVNMNMMPFHINEISEAIDKDCIDNYYCKFLMNNDQREFIYLKESCMKQLDTSLAKAFNECLFAFNNRKYIICANTLLVILEGVLSKYSTNKKNTHMISLCEKRYNMIPKEREIKKVIWYVNWKFIEQLYCWSSFSKMEPGNLNRHWLLHGRSIYDIEEIDCLRIMNAIGTLCDVST